MKMRIELHPKKLGGGGRGVRIPSKIKKTTEAIAVAALK
jgi:hypothetical protein